MTAMRLKRYPSPSGGLALGKMGVGATIMRSILPAGARWVEYLEGTGTQYIDTGINPATITLFKTKFSTPNLDLSGNRVVFGGSSFSGYNWLFVFQNNSKLRYYGGGTALADITSGESATFEVEASASSTNYMDFVVAKNGVQTFAGTLDTHYGSSGNLYMYSTATGTYVANRLRIHYLTTSSRDFRPIAIGTTGYMLDLVSGEYLPYGNAGTGDFVIGPDINAPAI